MTIIRFALLAALLWSALLCTGCLTAERLAQAEEIARVADEQLLAGQEAVAAAREALTVAQRLAERVESDEARTAVAAAEGALVKAEEALPALQDAAATASDALEAARAAKEAGASWWQVLLAGAAAVATGGAGGAAVMGARAGKVTRALRNTIRYVGKLKPIVDASVGVGERKRLAEQTLDSSDVVLIQEERHRLRGQGVAT